MNWIFHISEDGSEILLIGINILISIYFKYGWHRFPMHRAYTYMRA